MKCASVIAAEAEDLQEIPGLDGEAATSDHIET